MSVVDGGLEWDRIKDLPSYMRRSILSLGKDTFGTCSLVCVDEGCAELFEAGVGLQWFQELGCLSVVEQGGLVDGQPGIQSLAALACGRFSSVVVFVSTILGECLPLLVETANTVLPYTNSMTIACNLSPAAHVDVDPKKYKESVYDDCAETILSSLNIDGFDRGSFQVNVKHIDLPMMMVGSNGFVFPRHASASFAPFGGSDTSEKYAAKKSMLTAHTLASLAKVLDVQAEAFCLGPMSQNVGRDMSFIPAHETSSGRRAAFVIIDRSFDMTTPSSHSRFLVHSMFGHNDEVWDNGFVSKPSLFHPLDESSIWHLNFLVSKSNREAALFIRKWLREAVRESSLKFTGRSKPGSASAADLEALSSVLKSNPEAKSKHSSLIQLSDIACSCLRESNDNIWELSVKNDEIVRLTCEDGPESLCGLILDELAAAGRGAPQPHGILSAVRHLLLGCHWLLKSAVRAQGVSTSDTQIFSLTDTARLCEALAESTLACIARWKDIDDESAVETGCKKETPWLSAELIGRLKSDLSNEDLFAAELEIRDASEEVIARVCKMSSLSGSSLEETALQPRMEQSDTQGLLVAAINDIVRGKSLSGLKHMSSSLTGLLKTGLGRIGLQQHHPGDYELVILFVVGGLGMNEISGVACKVDSMLAESHNIERKIPSILVGGSVLLQPADSIASIFSSGV
eukprot:jgi/Picsp_1/897/NSC_04383-R1_sec1 family domain-containing protein 2